MKISIKHMAKSYGQTQVLGDIALELEGVSALGIIGASGCGKSTLLRLLAGIESPDRGEIVIDGQSPQMAQKAFQSQLGYVFQTHNLFPHLTIEKNILLILEKVQKMSKSQAKQRVSQVLALLHMEEQAKKLPHQVSGGQAQRASIARALATNPRLLFLDEPTAALDPILTAEVLQSIQNLKAEGREFVFVTHEMDFLRQFCDYVVFMEHGAIVEHGSVETLAHPKTLALQHFLQP